MADSEAGAGEGGRTYTQEEMDQLLKEKLAEAKAEGDKAFENLWEEAKAAKKRLKDLEGVDPDEYRQIRTELQELKTQRKADKAGITSEELDKLRREVRESLEQEYAGLQGQVEELQGENRALKLDNVVKAQMGQSGVLANRIDSLFRLTADQFDLTDDGEPMLKDKMGLEVDQYIKEDLRKEYPEWFEGTGSSGGGAPSRSNAGGGGRSKVVQDGDNEAFISNLEDIAAGKVEVR